MKIKKAIISGGGTGGHIFPAVAIADELRKNYPTIELLFIGAEGKMEMEKVPAAGYNIIGLPIRGFQRRLTFSNFLLPFKIIQSLLKARKIIKDFQPDIVIGVGGYASGPTLKMAGMLGIPTLLQEQNSFAGKTNILLAKKAHKICVAYENMERFFPKEKLIFTGNPVREQVVAISGKRAEGFQFFNLDPTKKTVLVVGGSLGARTLNNSVKNNLKTIQEQDIQVIWQCGKLQHKSLQEELNGVDLKGISLNEFITKMDLAYAAADVIISRAGAIAVSELCIIGKPTVLVPSPNVAEDHQTKNALALVEKEAAVYVKDSEANETLIPTTLELLKNNEKQEVLKQNILKMGVPNAAERIVATIKEIVG